MKNIVVPTDFSKTAKQALNFTERMVCDLFPEMVQIEVVHFYSGLLNTQKPLIIKEGVPADLAVQKEVEYFIEHNVDTKGEAQTNREKLNIVARSSSGAPDSGLIKLTKKENIDLVVMGTAGENEINIERRLFGSTATAVSQKADCPVLLIPPGLSYQGFKNILVASGELSPSKKDLQILKELTVKSEANYHFVNTITGDEVNFIEPAMSFAREITGVFLQQNRTHIYQVEAPTVALGLEAYATRYETDLLVITTKRRSFLEELIHESQTKNMIIHSTMPILVLHV